MYVLTKYTNFEVKIFRFRPNICICSKEIRIFRTNTVLYRAVRLLIGGNYWYAGLSVQRKVVQSTALYCAARLLFHGNYWYAGLSVQRKVAQSTALYCAARLLFHGNYWYAGLSVRGEY